MSYSLSYALIEAVARALEGLEPGESWPTAEDLGDIPGGVLALSYRLERRAEARRILAAAVPYIREEIMDALEDAGGTADAVLEAINNWRKNG